MIDRELLKRRAGCLSELAVLMSGFTVEQLEHLASTARRLDGSKDSWGVLPPVAGPKGDGTK